MQTAGWIVELGRVVRFGVVGVLATLVYAGATIAAVEIFGLSPVPASIVGQATSTAVSYFGHALFSFRVRPERSYLLRFLAIAALTFGMNFGLTWLLTVPLGLSYRISVMTLSILIPVTNYLCNRFWVFVPGRAAPERPGLAPGSPRTSWRP